MADEEQPHKKGWSKSKIRKKQWFQSVPQRIRAGHMAHRLMETGNYYCEAEAKRVVAETPEKILRTRHLVPVRVTVRSYPKASIETDEDLEPLRSAILEAVAQRNGAPIVNFVRDAGYVLVLTANHESAHFVNAVIKTFSHGGTTYKEPQWKQIKQYLANRDKLRRLKPKPKAPKSQNDKKPDPKAPISQNGKPEPNNQNGKPEPTAPKIQENKPKPMAPKIREEKYFNTREQQFQGCYGRRGSRGWRGSRGYGADLPSHFVQARIRRGSNFG